MTSPDDTRSQDPPAITRSEEELTVDTRPVVTGRMRLAKRLVTETVTQTVEIRREELDIENLGVGDDERPTVAALEDQTLEIILSREEVVVTKRVVAYERVRVHKSVVTVEQTIDEQLRKERVDVRAPGGEPWEGLEPAEPSAG